MIVLEALTVEPLRSVRDAMMLLDQNSRGILFVTAGRKLLGVVTDGDIRRALLAGFDLDSSISSVMNTNFISLPVSADNALIRNTFSSKLKMVPLCDGDGNLVDVADAQKSHKIPLINPDLSGREAEYLLDCLETNWISSQGAYVRRFEEEFERIHNGRNALAVSNGTVALHLALHAIGVGVGDEVIVPDVTFAACANAILYCGAVPVLCEIDPRTFCIDPAQAEKLITRKTKAIMPVHLYGQPCDMDAVCCLAKKHNLFIVEDCAEAIGSRWMDEPVGIFGDVATFSFFGNKTISTGEGGMILFKDTELYKNAKKLRDHGMTPDKKYWHDHVGFNYRLTNLQSAIGVAQMERLNVIIEKKTNIFNLYTIALEGAIGINSLPLRMPKSFNSNWLYTILLDDDIDRDSIIAWLQDFGIECRPTFYPLHVMPPYQKFRRSESLAISEKVSRTGLSLPTSVSLSEDEIDYICQHLTAALIHFK